ncbi:hypothetical protein RIB2604_02108320 [Aspergillus luchuensis]|uniref:Uncharacterized protein n=1 Tax=Aspergillus kawachii TaxID=1069201 RepID=A0A146FNH2_ASPKA|nr:hypothetical protein RIB2604_02108320 [Aspergillus luchuensis]
MVQDQTLRDDRVHYQVGDSGEIMSVSVERATGSVAFHVRFEPVLGVEGLCLSMVIIRAVPSSTRMLVTSVTSAEAMPRVLPTKRPDDGRVPNLKSTIYEVHQIGPQATRTYGQLLPIFGHNGSKDRLREAAWHNGSQLRVISVWETPLIAVDKSHTDTAVDSVLREEASNELRATGVVTQLLDGSSKTVDATKEIVVSGAAYCSSAIMMRGSREELVQFNIDGKIDLPGVGEPDGLSDHFYLLRDRKGRPDKLLASYHKSNRAKAYMQ